MRKENGLGSDGNTYVDRGVNWHPCSCISGLVTAG